MTKVKIDGKVYCVETLIHERERLIKEIKASDELHRLVLEDIKAEIENVTPKAKFQTGKTSVDVQMMVPQEKILQIIDKHIAESEDKE